MSVRQYHDAARSVRLSNKPEEPITRRNLLGTALGATMLGTAVFGAQKTPTVPPRTRESIDFGWKFLKGDVPGAQAPAFADATWRDVDLPHDWSVEGPFAEDEPTGGPGGYLPTGIGWYRKRFQSPDDYRNRKVAVEFDGVYQNSEVWINGRYLGKRPYGYITFAYDLTPHIQPGENILAVRVDNSHQPNSRWYSGSGIYRHTWLVVTNLVHVAQWGTFITTQHISDQMATVRVQTRIRNESQTPRTCNLTNAILDANKHALASIETVQEISRNGDYEFTQDLQLEKPALWSPETPNLYTMHSTVHVNGNLVDQYNTPFGVREAVFDADRGFLLNGQHVKLNGVCLHEGAGPVGAAVPERVWERRLETLKEMGANAIRTCHNPPAPEFLDLCDRMGFLVMDEAFDEWRVGKGQIGPYGYALYFDEWHERDVIDFVHRDRNHPSIVLWSAGNEIPDQTHPGGTETLRELLEIFHREDPTRPVTAACDQIAAEPKAAPAEFLNLLDVVGYNYVDRWRDRREKYCSMDKLAYPGRRFIGTESSGMGGVRGDYRWLWPGAAPTFFGFRSNSWLDTEQLWKFVSTYDYISGDFMWAGIDYLGEARWPSRSSSSGILDTCGFKKDGFYFYQSQWTKKPLLHLFPHWNWNGREGQFTRVLCYTNCDTVELFLNGKSVGLKGFDFPRLGMVKKYGTYPARARVLRTTNDLHLSWDVPYEPGTLKAIGTKDGKVAIETEVSTTGEPAAIVLSADRTAIHSGQRDVVHVTAQITDGAGRTVPDADHEITFEILGEGKLIGLDNGDSASHEDFKANRRTTFHGLCLAILQSTNSSGEIHIAASSPGLQPHSLIIASTA
ncbi:MAG TPA: glycoside hydrolase family 2 TIM barrel-domain containing protein [Bryobacteraceae bacterium]|nr:glycoside hydrolase family 2 TIM barrel-domain containing protein [Bryobacteraceae bacterium]